MQPPEGSGPRWSPDGMYWWDGRSWIPAAQLPAPPPPPVPPSYYMVPPAAGSDWAPSPGLRAFLIVLLVIEAVLTGLFSLAGIAGVSQSPDPLGVSLLVLFLAIFLLSVLALIAVFQRLSWARWVALAAGIGVSLTCLGLVIGIPVIVSAARAPLAREPSAYSPPTAS